MDQVNLLQGSSDQVSLLQSQNDEKQDQNEDLLSKIEMLEYNTTQDITKLQNENSSLSKEVHHLKDSNKSLDL